MMIHNSIRKMLSVIGVFVLIAAMALNFTGCGSTTAPETTGAAPEEATGVSFTFVVTDLEGNDTSFDITTDKKTVGEALLDEELIAGDMGEYGLYVTSVNGIAADWDKDQTYWAFYIDGEYAMTGVDATEVTAGATYSFVLTGPEEEAASGSILGEGATVFQFTIVDLEGNETAYEIHTDETTVGAALLALELISGDASEYGLYINSVNGIEANWDKDQTYWAFYVDGEYAMTGVDSTEIDPSCVYSLVLTKG